MPRPARGHPAAGAGAGRCVSGAAPRLGTPGWHDRQGILVWKLYRDHGLRERCCSDRRARESSSGHAGDLRHLPRQLQHPLRRRNLGKRFYLRSENRGALPALTLSGQVIAAHGRHYLVETGDGRHYACFPRGKQSSVACGDRVMFAPTADAQGVIEAVDPRSSLFSRSAAHRQKLIAANVTQLAIVVAAEPSFSEELINRCLIAAEYQDMRTLILLNKCDLADAARAALSRLEPYLQAGYRVIELSALEDAEALRPLLARQATVLVGQSGMGKSTIINALFPDAHVSTREISLFLASGRHTTTEARLYRLDADSTLIDCPGLQEFGLHHLSPQDIETGFVEFRNLHGQCRFQNCRHMSEPGCALTQAAASGAIHPRRLDMFRRISRAESG
ncbi:MAG: ribosome small subunit-dependent GTPase A [Betaproteobacteria bacterium]|nr:MAG: ribosome small subunit-dependent GTPase A [Betaproteobacteria bacterium]